MPFISRSQPETASTFHELVGNPAPVDDGREQQGTSQKAHQALRSGQEALTDEVVGAAGVK